jgi:hypothetical protein
MGADGADATAEFESLPNDVSQLVEISAKLPPVLFCNITADTKKCTSSRGIRWPDFSEGNFERNTKIMFLKGAAELARQGFLEFPDGSISKSNRKAMTSPHRTRNKLQAFRELLLNR